MLICLGISTWSGLKYWGIVRFLDMEFICGYKQGMVGGASRSVGSDRPFGCLPQNLQMVFFLNIFVQGSSGIGLWEGQLG